MGLPKTLLLIAAVCFAACFAFDSTPADAQRTVCIGGTCYQVAQPVARRATAPRRSVTVVRSMSAAPAGDVVMTPTTCTSCGVAAAPPAVMYRAPAATRVYRSATTRTYRTYRTGPVRRFFGRLFGGRRGGVFRGGCCR